MSQVSKEEWILPWLGSIAIFWGLIYFFAGVLYGCFIVKRITGKKNIECLKIAAAAQGVTVFVAFYAIPVMLYLLMGVLIDMWMLAFVNIAAGVLIDYCVLHSIFKTRVSLKDSSWLVLWNVGSLVTGVCFYLFACMISVVTGAD